MYRAAPEVLGVTMVGGAAGQAAGLAATGFAFGLYLVVALALILVGIILRRTAMARA